MRRPILVGYDPKAADPAPVEFGSEMARLTGASLVIGCVQAGAPALPLNPGAVQPYAIAQPDADLLADCAPALRRVESELSTRRIKYDCVKLESTSAARALQEEAERDRAAMLVIGSSRRAGSRQVAAGSTAERLLHGAPCPVDVVPPDWTARSTVSTIGAAWTDSEEAREALRAAWALARRVGAELRAFTVVRDTLQMHVEAEPRIKDGQLGKDLIDVLGEHKLYALMRLEEEAAALGGEVPVMTEAFEGDPAEVLVDLSRGVDLLVLGSRGYGPLRSVLLGSVSRRVMAKAHCPVSVLPRGVKAPLDALLGETKARARPAAPRPATTAG